MVNYAGSFLLAPRATRAPQLLIDLLRWHVFISRLGFPYSDRFVSLSGEYLAREHEYFV